MPDLAQLGLVAVLVLVNALFAGSEIALISLRPAQVERLRVRGGAGRALARLAGDPNRFLATIQIAITLSGFMASAAAAVSLAEPLIPAFAAFGRAAEGAAIVVVTLILTFFTLVFGELAPKRIAMQHAEIWGLTVARPLDAIATAARPIVWLLSTSTNVVVRLAGSDPTRQRAEVTEEEIRDMVAAQRSLSPEERRVVAGALEVGDRSLRQVLVPRGSVFALSAALPIDQALPQVLASGHSRVPVYDGTPERVVGVVQLRSMLDHEGLLADIAVPLLAFPESAPVLKTLRQLQLERQQMALIVDEHGGFEGIVTVEDLVEEIVGEIYDEYDQDIIEVVPREDGTLEVPGTFPVHDLVDLGIQAPEGPYTTVAGFILDELGRIPVVGDSVDMDGCEFTVAAMSGNAITRVVARTARRDDDMRGE